MTSPAPRRAPGSDRAAALFEVILCSGFPTQIALGALLAAIGFAPDGTLSLEYVVVLSLLDTLVLLGLIFAFLSSAGESPRHLLFGGQPIPREAIAGVPLAFVALALAVIVLSVLREFAPWLRTLERNPFQDIVQTPREMVIFAIVVVVAGGVREEIQRAFLLSRFEQSLGGAAVGLVVTSLAFGAGHLLQGADAAVATGLLGAFWAAVYLRRRSIVAPVVSHSGFNLVQLTQFFVR